MLCVGASPVKSQPTQEVGFEQECPGRVGVKRLPKKQGGTLHVEGTDPLRSRPGNSHHSGFDLVPGMCVAIMYRREPWQHCESLDSVFHPVGNGGLLKVSELNAQHDKKAFYEA